MYKVSDKKFDEIMAEAIEKIPEPYKSRVNNIAFLIEDEPSLQQRQRMGLHPSQTLLGLYEGTPLPQRGGTTKLLPDKITLYKLPLEASSATMAELKENIKHTIWHEVAHYFGLDHKRIYELDSKL